ncbi:MAG: adenylate kinase [archaeon]
MNIVLMGPQGCGKGTQAELLSSKTGLPHISTGDIFRDSMASDTVMGRTVKSYLDQGQLVPDEHTIEVVADRISREDCANGYILDGYPRNLNQAKALDRIASPDAVLVIVVPDDVVTERIGGRRVCRCGAVYHVLTNPPSRPRVCDRCGGQLTHRDDDRPSAIAKRLKIYHKESSELQAYYSKKLHSIDGQKSIGEVFSKVRKSLGI